MNKKLSITKKEILYLFCFLGFNLIEWLRGTQPGNIWMVAENCTGFLVFFLILSVIPKEEWEKAAGGCFGWCRVDSIYCGGDSLVQVGQKLSSMEIYNGGLECGMDGLGGRNLLRAA